jgi:hypothetical protein
MRELILEKNHMNVTSVGVPSERKLTCMIIREFILEKSLMLVRNVGKTSVEAQLLLNTREFIHEINSRNPKINVYIENFSSNTVPLQYQDSYWRESLRMLSVCMLWVEKTVSLDRMFS